MSRKATLRPIPKWQVGFSLVELMIAIVLGLLLSAGIISIYAESKRNYGYEEELSRLQENGRYALGVLKRELTLAGFVGGIVDISGITPIAVATDCATGNWATDATTPIDLINNFNSSFATVNGVTFTCLDSSEIQSGTDIVSVKRTAGDYTLKDGEFNIGASADDNQWYLRVKEYGESLGYSYITAGFPTVDKTAGSLVDYWEYYAKIFYIRDFSTTDGDDIPTLCVERLIANNMGTEVIVEGIEDMQIEFGIDTDEDNVPNRFKQDPTAAELSTVVTARIYLLVRSVNTVPSYSDGAKTYTLGTKNVAAQNDGFLRKVFSTTVQLRNAVLPNE